MSNLNKAIVHNYADLSDPMFGREDIHEGGTYHEPHLNKRFGTADEDSIADYEHIQSSPNEEHETVFRASERPEDIYGNPIETPSLGIAPKGIYKSKATGRKFLVKAYHFNPDGEDPGAVGDGFGESVISDMYKSGNIGHLIQKTHISRAPVTDPTGQERDMPLLVVHMDPHSVTGENFVSTNQLTHPEIHSMHPDKMKIEAMDYITGNIDRHHNNVMFRLDPHTGRPASLMAIDNNGFSYENVPGAEMLGYGGGFRQIGFFSDYDEVHAHDFARWWKDYSPMIRLTFHKHIPHVKNWIHRDTITLGFDARCARLDRMVDHYTKTGEWKKIP